MDSKLFLKITGVIDTFGIKTIDAVRSFGEWGVFVIETLSWAFKKPFRMRNILSQMEFIGVKSVSIISLTGLFVGAVFALQTGKAFALFHAESLVGATIGLSIAREIGPVFTALMVTARCCSAMAAEIGTMRVTEQIDALDSMAVNPMHYLVWPRVAATVVMSPLLASLFAFVAVVGSYFVGVYLLGIPAGPFMHKLYYYVDVDDFLGGLLKAAVFGLLISLISCYQGYKADGGAAGVGRATTRAVVISSVAVLVSDYFLTSWILEFISGRGGV